MNKDTKTNRSAIDYIDWNPGYLFIIRSKGTQKIQKFPGFVSFYTSKTA